MVYALKKSLGICIGASTLKIVLLEWHGDTWAISSSKILSHECDPKKIFFSEMNALGGEYDFICITGRKFKDLVSLPTVTEPEASESVLKYFFARNSTSFNALISLGSENFILYELNEFGNIINVRTGNKCASGTGDFFLQQIRRMNVDVETATDLATASAPYRVSGRCSVFCKSDCTHALNKGIPIGEVCAGLGDMISEKILELLHSIPRKNILIAGGVAKNSYVVNRLKEKIENLTLIGHADVFEALGAAIYAYENRCIAQNFASCIGHHSFTHHLPLQNAAHLVSFREQQNAKALTGDECILGLDVGSTTTKAVLLHLTANKILASVYLRTNGNPIKAAKACYAELKNQVHSTPIKIKGLGVTGSGRHIAGLHALTDGIINEIIAHATAATFFDPEVDTILEIGGQDAKYTFLVNGVPCDYAMNEACSAGTGSFLEEAAKESLNIDYLDIQDVALSAQNPPNFNDQCAAFISSDIKNASHENVSREDIVAGLVYSICMNYNNRVKGARKIGKKIFMQGGVCYNKAVPIAMAAILGKEIIVPPKPGLMGAFGVALEVKNRLSLGLLPQKEFFLDELIMREVAYGKNFVCSGTSEKCDRKCTINVIKLNDKSYPFGGICNKYYNQMHHITAEPTHLDFIDKRQNLVFQTDNSTEQKNRPTIGIIGSYLVNTLFPLYFNFFDKLGMRVILGDEIDKEGLKKIHSSFCFPAEISHGLFMNVLTKNPDFIFLPHVTELRVENSIGYAPEYQSVCIIAQSEPYYLQSAFKTVKTKILSPILDFSQGWHTAENTFVKLGNDLGFDTALAKKAFALALQKQENFFAKRKTFGRQVLDDLAKNPQKIAIVLFGRAYNAFSPLANLGIPRKFATRGFYIIPFDFLPFENEENFEKMTWAAGQDILRAARVVKKNTQLFGVYVTNFSCGPDSFLVGYFRDIMQTKPSLTLEFDSHSADAGINTRIEAFLDIVERFRKLQIADPEKENFMPAQLIHKGKNFYCLNSKNEELPIKHKKVKVIFPTMGKFASEMCAAVFRGLGFSADAVPLSDFKTLMVGRANSSCKECLPLILTMGSLLEYVAKYKKDDEFLLYFMPTSTGGCRFAQYYVFMKKVVEKKQLKDVAFLTLSSEHSYAGLGPKSSIKTIQGLIIADIIDDIRNTVMALAEDQETALSIVQSVWQSIIKTVEIEPGSLTCAIKKACVDLKKIKLKCTLGKAKKVLLGGEIYVRHDEFSSQEIVNRLAKKGIVALRAPILEWIYYIEYVERNTNWQGKSLVEKLEFFLCGFIQRKIEKKIKAIFATSGLYHYEPIDIKKIIDLGNKFVKVTGETVLSVGAFFKHMINDVHGFISVGPFACMPTRVVEAILAPEAKIAGNDRLESLENFADLAQFANLPFMSIECDGNPFPQIIESRLEAFCLQVDRVSKALRGSRS